MKQKTQNTVLQIVTINFIYNFNEMYSKCIV